jgi:hypothetical protein
MAEEPIKSSEQNHGTPESGEGRVDPTVPAQPVGKKPIKTMWIATYGLIGLAALGLVSNVARLHSWSREQQIGFPLVVPFVVIMF